MPAWECFALLSPQRAWLTEHQPLPDGRAFTRLIPQPLNVRDVGWWFSDVRPLALPDRSLFARFVRHVLAMDRLFVKLITSKGRGAGEGGTDADSLPLYQGDQRPRPTLEQQLEGARAARERAALQVVGQK